MMKLTSNLQALDLEILNELNKLDLDNLPIDYQKKCIKFVIAVLDYTLENFDNLDVYEYIDNLGSYYLQFIRDSKGKEVVGLMLVLDNDPITDVFLELCSLDEPYDKEDIKRIRNRFESFLQF